MSFDTTLIKRSNIKASRYAIDIETVIAVGDFCILWNQFERVFFDKDANINQIKNKTLDIEITPHLCDLCTKIQEVVLNVYEGLKTVDIVDKFYSSPKHGYSSDKGLIQFFINSRDVPFSREALMGCFIMIYRIRNNMFHGTKDIWMLNDQREIFKAINCMLDYMLLQKDM